jgi:hypothetical protein
MYQSGMASSDRAGAHRSSECGSECSTPDDIALLVSGKGDEARRLAILDHVMACAACQREFDLVRAADRAGRDLGAAAGAAGGAVVSRRRGWVQTYGTLLAAAAVLIAVGLTVNTMRTRAGAVTGVGESGNSGVLRGADGGDAAGAIRLISPGRDSQLQLPLTLVWHPYGAELGSTSGYHVEVLDSAGAPVLVRDNVRDTTLAVPGDQLRAGENYSWWVSASVAGSTVRSALFGFRLMR